MPSRQELRTAFRQKKAISPLYTAGPVVVTDDGHFLFSCVQEDVLVTQLETGVEQRRFSGDSTAVTALAISPASRHFVSISAALTLRIYELDIQSEPLNFSIKSTRQIAKAHDAPVHVLQVDPSSNLLASGSADGLVKVWDLVRGYVTHSFAGHGGILSALTFYVSPSVSQSSIHLVTASVDTRIRVFNLSSQQSRGSSKPLAVLEGHNSVPRGLCVSSDGKWLLSGGRDSLVMVWDFASITDVSQGNTAKGKKAKGKLLQTIPVFERVEAVGLLDPETAGTQSSLRFFTGGEKGNIRIWDLQSGKVVSTLGEPLESGSEDQEEQQGIVSMSHLRACDMLVSVHADQNIIFYSISTGSVTRQLVGFNDEIVDCTFLSPRDDERDSHLALATNSALIRVYDVSSLDARILAGHADIVLSLDTSSDGRTLGSGSKDKTARIWMPPQDSNEPWRPVAVCEGHTESVGALAFARKTSGTSTVPDFLFTGSQDRTIKMWDLSPLRSESTASTPLKLRSLTTQKAHEKDINSLDVSPDNSLLASGSQDKTIKLFQITYSSSSKSGDIKLLGTCKGHKRGVWSVRFSRTERVLASGSGDKTIRIWSLDDYTCLKTLEGHTNSVLRVDFINAGLQVVSSASDGLVKLWNVKDEHCVTSMDNHEDKVWALCVSHDERTIVSGAADSVVTFWKDCTEEEREEKAKSQAHIILKEQDLSNYLALHDYKNAILLALALNQPRKLLAIFNSVRDSAQETEPKSISGDLRLDDAIRTFSGPDLVLLLWHIRAWNVNARTSGVAQFILHAILKLRPFGEIVAAYEIYQKETTAGQLESIGKDKIKIQDVLEGLIPYTERHLNRLDRLVQESYVVDLILGEMDNGLELDEMDVDEVKV
ncbi:U3 small nucleolar RNA-associated protein [Sistotremastrum niveocremeum HHB9708]|uniref:U3 small nucleolar RNA-associated protein n=1 Tax=Sistotremastrum niveocremeum HHB9708 TaxID=1314777 RepID=A0A164UK23_9AGAM|nr:U3 small nucleolar RNA-associated protein [Sistotremastrum niveocremeum HHB9708]